MTFNSLQKKQPLILVSLVLMALILVPSVSAFQWCDWIPFWSCQDDFNGYTISQTAKWVKTYSTDTDLFLYTQDSKKHDTTIWLLSKTVTAKKDLPDKSLSTGERLSKDELKSLSKAEQKSYKSELKEQPKLKASVLKAKDSGLDRDYVGYSYTIKTPKEKKVKFGKHSTVIEYVEDNLEIKNDTNNVVQDITLTYNTEQCLTDCEARGTSVLYQEDELFNGYDFVNRLGVYVNLSNVEFYVGQMETFNRTIDTYDPNCTNTFNATNNSWGDVCDPFINGTNVTYYDKVVYHPYNFETLPIGSYYWKIKARKDPSESVDWAVSLQGFDTSIIRQYWAWWGSQWQYKRLLSNLTGEYPTLNISWQTGMNADFSDLRFLGSNETFELYYTIRNLENSSWAYVTIDTNNISGNFTTGIGLRFDEISTPLSSKFDAYYNLNNDANDIFGNYNGTITGATQTSGKLDGGYDFVGSNDWVDAQSTGGYAYNEDWSMGAWVYPRDVTSGGVFFSFGGGNGVFSNELYTTSDGYAILQSYTNGVGSAVFTTTTTKLQKNKWTYLVVTYDGTTKIPKIYIDGELSATGSPSTSTGSAGQGLIISGYNDTASPTTISSSLVDSKVDEVFISNSTLNITEIQELYNNQTFDSSGEIYMYYGNENATTTESASDTFLYPISYWDFEGGNTLSDDVGTNDLVNTGATADFPGHLATAYDFDGISNFLDGDSGQGFAYNENWSMTGWINTDVSASSGVMFSFGGGLGAFSNEVYTDGAGTLTWQSYTNGVSGTATFPAGGLIIADTWYHVAMVYTGATKELKLYQDGVLVDTKTGTSTGTAGNGALIATYDDYGQASKDDPPYFDGTIDEVALYDKALTSNEIQELYSMSDQTNTYVLGAELGNVPVVEETIIGAWNVTLSKYLQRFYLGSDDFYPADIYFKSDGTRMYMLGPQYDKVYEYNLSTAWNVTSAILLQSFSISGRETDAGGLTFNDDGTKMYTVGTSGKSVDEYDLSVAWNVTTAVYLQEFNVQSEEYNPAGVTFKTDGTKMYVIGTNADAAIEYNLSTAWNVSSAVYHQSFSVGAKESIPKGLFFKPDGTRMYVTGQSGKSVDEYNLTTPWDVSTSVYLYELYVGAEESSPGGLYFRSDGGKMYLVGTGAKYVNEYNIIDTPPTVTVGDGNPVNNTMYLEKTFTFNASDVGDDVKVKNVSLIINDSITNTTINPTNGSNVVWTNTFVDGFYEWYFLVYDSSNQSTNTSLYNFRVDTLPEVNITAPDNGTIIYQFNQAFDLNWTATDNNLETCWSSYQGECYQESTNTSNQTGIDGDCNQLYLIDSTFDPAHPWDNFSALIDGDWNTYSAAGSSNLRRLSSNYTIPLDVNTPPTAKVKVGSTNYTYTIPDECFYNKSSVDMWFLVRDFSSEFVQVSCWNSTGSRIEIDYLNTDEDLYEEAMIWESANNDKTLVNCSLNTTTLNYPASNPDESTFYFYANDTYGNQRNDSVTLVKYDQDPEVNITAPSNGTIIYQFNQSYDLNWTITTPAPLGTCWYSQDGGTPVFVSCSANTTTLNYPTSNPDDSTVYFYATDTLGNEGNDSVTVVKSTSEPIINLSSPIDYYSTLTNGNSVDLNWSITNTTVLDECWYSYNGVNTTVTCENEHTTFSYVSGVDIVYFYANDTLNNFNSTSKSWIILAVTDKIIFEESVIETDETDFTAVFNTTPEVTSLTGNLIYDGNVYAATPITGTAQTNLTVTIDVPLVNADVNKSFFFNITVSTVNFTGTTTTNTNEQTVNDLELTRCDETDPQKIINYTTKIARTPFDELNTTFASTWYYYISTGTGNIRVNTSYEDTSENDSLYSFCLNKNVSVIMNNQIEVSATGYVPSTNFLVGATLNNVNITSNTIYLLNSTLADATVLQVYDIAGRPVGNVLINVQYFDIGTNTFITVTQALTSSIGSDVVYLNWLDSLYKFVLIQDGTTVQTTLPENIFESPRIFSLEGQEELTFQKFEGIDYSLYYTNTTQNFVLTFSKPDGKFTTGCLRVRKKSPSADTTICDTCSTAASATLLCDISSYGDGVYYATFYGTEGTSQGINWILEIVGNSFSQTIGTTLGSEDSTFYAFLLGLLIVGVMIVSPFAGIAAILVSLLIANLLGFVLINYITLVGITIVGILVSWVIRK